MERTILYIASFLGLAGWILAIRLWRSTDGRRLESLNKRADEVHHLNLHLQRSNKDLTEERDALRSDTEELRKKNALLETRNKLLEEANDLLRHQNHNQNVLNNQLKTRLGEHEKYIIKLCMDKGIEVDLTDLLKNAPKDEPNGE